MPTPNSRKGFTLIEILCAMGAFILVFLTGSGGLMRLMMQQTNNQQSTIAASGALLLADWHATKALAALPSLPPFKTFKASIALTSEVFTDLSDYPAYKSPHTTATLKGQIRFKGATPDNSEEFYVFKASANYPGPLTTISLSAYDQLAFSITEACMCTTGAGQMKYRVVTFWYGDPASIISLPNPLPDSFVFVGRYLMPEAL